MIVDNFGNAEIYNTFYIFTITYYLKKSLFKALF